MRFTLQTHFEREWHHAATPELKDDGAGFHGESVVDYDLDYFATSTVRLRAHATCQRGNRPFDAMGNNA